MTTSRNIMVVFWSVNFILNTCDMWLRFEFSPFQFSLFDENITPMIKGITIIIYSKVNGCTLKNEILENWNICTCKKNNEVN